MPLGVEPPSPINGTNFKTFFYPTFFLLQMNPTYMKRILHFKNITFKSSYNWFIIDIHQQLRPLTANAILNFHFDFLTPSLTALPQLPPHPNWDQICPLEFKGKWFEQKVHSMQISLSSYKFFSSSTNERFFGDVFVRSESDH